MTVWRKRWGAFSGCEKHARNVVFRGFYYLPVETRHCWGCRGDD